MGEPIWLKILAGTCGGLALLAVVWRLIYSRPVIVCGRCRNYPESCTCPQVCPECGAHIAPNAKLNPLLPLSLRQELPGEWADAAGLPVTPPLHPVKRSRHQSGSWPIHKRSAQGGAERP